MNRDSSAKLEFVQNMEYKYLELLTLDFNTASDDLIRQNITYRYSCLKTRFGFINHKLSDIAAIVKLKNPNLLAQIQRSTNYKGGKAIEVRSSNETSGRNFRS